MKRKMAIIGAGVAGITAAHPTYTFDAIASQRELARLNRSGNTHLCGSYFGYGFHEDAVKNPTKMSRGFLDCYYKHPVGSYWPVQRARKMTNFM